MFFAHEFGWKFGGYQQPTCSQHIKHQNLLCAHNSEGNNIVVKALRFLVAQDAVTAPQLNRLLGLLSLGTIGLYEADIQVHYAALRQMSRDGARLCSSDRADAMSPRGSEHEAVLLGGAVPSQQALEEKARMAQQKAGAPIKLVSLFCRELLSEIAGTRSQHDLAHKRSSLQGKVERFLAKHCGAGAVSIASPWAPVSFPAGSKGM